MIVEAPGRLILLHIIVYAITELNILKKVCILETDQCQLGATITTLE